MAILTPTEFRQHVSTDVVDAALQRLLDAAEESIVAYAGAPGSTVELFNGGGRVIALNRPVGSITSITEMSWGATVATTLSTNDYLIHPNGYLLTRLVTGDNGRSAWYGRVTVTYTPADEEANRERVQIALVELDLNHAPGSSSEQIGAWMEQRQSSSVWNYGTEREAILATLRPGPAMVVIG